MTDTDGHAVSASSIEPKSVTRHHRWPRRVLGWLVGTVSTLVVAAIVALAVGLTVVPAVAGGHTLTVLSGSMVPRLPVGSVVVDKPVPAGSLRVGDIVTYAKGHDLITHRIVQVKSDSGDPVFTTKGDANNTADQKPVHASQIRGKLWYDVPYIGTTRNFLASRAGLTAIGGGVLLIAAVWFLIRISRPNRSDGHRGDS
jgi:signal peptidase